MNVRKVINKMELISKSGLDTCCDCTLNNVSFVFEWENKNLYQIGLLM